MDKAPPKKHENTKGELITFSLFSDDQMKPVLKQLGLGVVFRCLHCQLMSKLGFLMPQLLI